MKKQYLFILAGVGAILAGSAFLASSSKISNEMSRAYWNFTHGGIMDLRYQSIEMLAGCQMRQNMELTTDQGMTNIWQKESGKYHFDAIDVDRHIMNHCPPSTPEEARKYWTEYYKNKDYPDMDEERETQELIEKSIKLSEYQHKFLNREFTALKDEPKE